MDEDAFNFGCHSGQIPPCNNDITIDDGSCINYPDKFIFSQSQLQAFYIVENAVIQQDEVEDLEILVDWIGVFKDSVCVGAYPWTGNMTTIPAMGYDGSSLTGNYLLAGDYPTFQIYDSSDSTYLNTEGITITNYDGGVYNGWENWGFFFIEEMLGLETIIMNWEFSTRVDLISYLGIPGDSSILTVMEPLGQYALGMIGEGQATMLGADGVWIGSLQEINPTSGYWIILDIIEPLETAIEYSIVAPPTDPNIEYHLHERLNLISYVGPDGAGLDDALPDNIEMNIQSLQTAGKAAMRTEDGSWIGSLTEWNVLTGYWANVYVDGDMSTYDIITFSFVNEGLSRNKHTKLVSGWNNQLPNEFQYVQSASQAFYFIDNVVANGENIYPGDWIIAYNKDIVVGARQWNGESIDIPVMGYDGYPATASYCKTGDTPEFKLYRSDFGELINLSGEFTPWTNNLISYAGTLENVISIPTAFNLGKPYPNPFNPVAIITYDVPSSCEVELSVYDLRGRLVEELISGYIEAGYYEINWNARTEASGVYFLQLVTPEKTITRKMILMK